MIIQGVAGDIELVLDLPVSNFTEGSPSAFAVCCHPHPLFGGSLSNKVIDTVARSFVEAGVPTVRFNFRGVGASQGIHDKGLGELDDLASVVAWGRSKWPGIPVWLGGFSFGSWVVLRAQAALSPAILVTIAPPLGRWDFSGVSLPLCPWLIVQGEDDELVNAQAVQVWVNSLGSVAQNCMGQVVLVPKAEHFFHGRLAELRAAIMAFITIAA